MPKERKDESQEVTEFNEFARLFLGSPRPEDRRPEDIRLAAIVERERIAYDIPGSLDIPDISFIEKKCPDMMGFSYEDIGT